MKQISHWVPALFCAFLSLTAVGILLLSPSSGAWTPVFFGFLPMCFVFVGSTMSQMHREIRDLRKQVAKLQQSPTE